MKNRVVRPVDLRAEYLEIKKDIDRALVDVAKSGRYLLGEQTGQFEKEFSEYLGAKHALGVSSGTQALTIALKALGLGERDEVIIPANVYPTFFGVHHAGVNVRLADVDPHTLNISVDTLRAVMTKNTKAVVTVHLYGNPADMSSIGKLCRSKGIKLVEDCAQAVGAEYHGKKVGNFGDIACFSFYPTKNLGAYGDAGAIVTSSTRLHKRALLWRTYGEKARYKSILPGFNSRMDEIQAAILRRKLAKLSEWTSRRRKVASFYIKFLKNVQVEIIKEQENSKHAYHLFVVKARSRNRLLSYLKEKGVGAGVHYPTPVHFIKHFAASGYKKGNFPFAEAASRQVISLPIYSQISRADVEYVSSAIKSFYK